MQSDDVKPDSSAVPPAEPAVVATEPAAEPTTEPTVVATASNEDKKESVPKKKVVIALPGDTFSSNFLVNWSNTLISLWTSDKYDFAIAPATGTFLPHVRLQTLGLDLKLGANQKPFKGDSFDIWLTIDSNIIFTTEHIFEILASVEKHPVVGGMYRMADLAHFACVKTWDEEYYSKNGTFEFITPEFVENWKKETTFRYMPVNYSGLGFFALRKEVIDKMNYPYFDAREKQIKTQNSEMTMDNMSSEDVNFCNNIIDAGFEIVMDTNIRVGHLKPVII